jgi:putative FmdB family regulatory protein
MPTYEYRCPNGHDFEKFFRTISSSEASVACPVCGAMGVRQMSAGAGLVFKGSGFYLTDYGKNAHATRGGAKPSAPSEGGSKSEQAEAAGSKSAGESAKATSDSGGKSAGTTAGGDAAGAKSDGAKSTPKNSD